jgi:hypothetical protein
MSFFPGKNNFVSSLPGNGAKNMLFLSLYLRLQSIMSRHPKNKESLKYEKKINSLGKESMADF